MDEDYPYPVSFDSLYRVATISVSLGVLNLVMSFIIFSLTWLRMREDGVGCCSFFTDCFCKCAKNGGNGSGNNGISGLLAAKDIRIELLSRKCRWFIIGFCFFSFFCSFFHLLLNSYGLFFLKPTDNASYGGVVNATGTFLQTNKVFFCKYFLPKAYASLYGFANYCTFEYLHIRSNVIETSRSGLSRVLDRIAYYGNKGIIILCFFTMGFWEGEVVKTEIGREFCVDAVDEIFVGIFICLAFPLAIIYIYLFVAPLRQQFLNSNGEADVLIKKVIRKNMILSLTSIGSTGVATLFMAIAAAFYRPYPYVLQLALTFGTIDLIVNLVCLSSMSSLWVPSYILSFFNKRVTAESNAGIQSTKSQSKALTNPRGHSPSNPDYA